MLKQKLLYFFLLSFFFFQEGTAEQGKQDQKDIVLKEVRIQSLYQEQSTRPKIDHDYSLIQPTPIAEPFLPFFHLPKFELPKGFPQNVELTSMAKSETFGGLTSLFYGEDGSMQRGIVLVQNREFTQAEKLFAEVVEKQGEYAELANLWIGWLNVESNNWEEVEKIAQTLQKSQNGGILQEGDYLSTYFLFQQKKHSVSEDLIKNKIQTLGREKISFKLQYAFLLSLVEQKKWEEAKVEFEILLPSSVHTIQYPNILLLGGAIALNLGNYSRSQEILYEALKLQPNSLDQKELILKLAWSHYLQKEYQELLDLLDRVRPVLQGVHDKGEIMYLEISSALFLKKFDRIEEAFNSISSQSPFHRYAGYKIFLQGKHVKKISHLYEYAQFQHYPEDELRQYVLLRRGNEFFQKRQFEEAKTLYKKALAFLVGEEKELVYYNLASTYLKEGKYQQAFDLFVKIKIPEEHPYYKWIGYHSVYALYHLKDYPGLLEYSKDWGVFQLRSKYKAEINLMQGFAWLTQGKYKIASTQFLASWRRSHKLIAIEQAAIAYFLDDKFEEVIQLVQENEIEETPLILKYEIKSYLILGQPQKALSFLGRLEINSDESIQLLLEVWKANQKFEEIVQEIPKYLEQKNSLSQRLLYYLTLGDSYFNLKEYQKSKNYFFRALSISTDFTQRSVTHYNLVLTSFLAQDFPSFENQARLSLETDELIDENRFGINQMLSNYYFKKKEYLIADALLENYLVKTNYQAPKVHNRRVQIHYTGKLYESCYSIGSQAIKGESQFQIIDRLVMAGVCGNMSQNHAGVVDLLSPQIDLEEAYRKIEMLWSLAQAYFETGRHQDSNDLLVQLRKLEMNKRLGLESKLLFSKNLQSLHLFQEAEEKLGEINDYRKIQRYDESLALKADLLISQLEHKKALRYVLRGLYLPTSSRLQQQRYLLRATQIYLAQEQVGKAKSMFQKINIKFLEEDEKAVLLFQELQNKL